MIAYLQFIHIFQIQEHNSPPRAAQVAVECVKVLDDLLFPGWFFFNFFNSLKIVFKDQ